MENEVDFIEKLIVGVLEDHIKFEEEVLKKGNIFTKNKAAEDLPALREKLKIFQKILKTKKTLKKLSSSECRNLEDHQIGQNSLGGFPGHPQIHPYGPQICLKCGKTLTEIVEEQVEKKLKNK